MNTPDSLPRRMRRTLAETLEPSEETLWLARAMPRVFTTRTTAPFTLGVMIVSMMSYAVWEHSQSPSSPGDWEHVAGIVFFMLIGLGFVSIPFVAWVLGRNTVYAVTDRRAIIFEGWPSQQIRAFPAGGIRWIRRDNYLGRSDLVLGVEATNYEVDGDNTREYGFLNIKNATEVEELLKAINTLAHDNPSAHAEAPSDLQSQLEAIPEHLAQRLHAELKPAETVVWRGVPAPRWFSSESLAACLFGILLVVCIGIFAVALLKGGASGGPDQAALLMFGAFFAMFLGVGVYLFFSPLGERLRSSNTVYAVTDRRVITITGSRERSTNSYRPEFLVHLTRIDRPKSRGDILIGEEAEIRDIKAQGGQPRGLYNIRDPARVERIIRELVSNYNARPSPSSRPAAPRPITRVIKRYN